MAFINQNQRLTGKSVNEQWEALRSKNNLPEELSRLIGICGERGIIDISVQDPASGLRLYRRDTQCKEVRGRGEIRAGRQYVESGKDQMKPGRERLGEGGVGGWKEIHEDNKRF